MAFGTNIRTWFEGRWHEGDVAVMRAADHGIWQGSSVFDGARLFDGLVPDLDLHCARVNRSATALMITPTIDPAEMVGIAREGLRKYAKGAAVYIRPMYWALDGSDLGVAPQEGATGFALCLEEVPMPPADRTTTLTTTQFRRPVLADNVCNAKAGCLYPNNARMLVEAKRKGFGNALVQDAMGNVAESATANVFIVKDGVVLTPIANGTFLAGITRARHMANLRAAGVEVREAVLTLEDVRAADEVFLSGNFGKVTPVTGFDDVTYAHGPMTKRIREIYMDWALSSPL
ncbi:branched-chain amino acid aminotransferase [Rhodobacter capsulatus]|jgi:branched-chain amino acid aminotransferase|uniref:Probable branched-chain-amino-acid aminotransferase n=1 Tax=Rhodobacter capsulatus (strain ATCC BAA-309 / NBRC 16581 / SB1003) TaxID=272942 RepID=D5ARE6_RHOCB|nr:branched-chain amino acid aminotransferase [Rhodobacter capsulatus]ADE86951.1 branched-chain-amino-acid transaminase-2 [Rhodobacter capsulatus SB 1003]ETD00481.1 aminotransferase [Rhodobacter capsulatus DE442]ETD74821.1 aminotransferase [Rhodobacter capsulatus R121]ETE52387.1 aminotransferase [Rhodobacter capsulatus Y262]MDS0928750.1 branched-chain amino acid aminotransferase [Rhodobacter capsulatus]